MASPHWTFGQVTVLQSGQCAVESPLLFKNNLHPLAMLRTTAITIQTGASVVVLLALLFSDSICLTFPGFLGSTLTEVVVVFRDSGTQWMVYLCLVIYFAVFVTFRSGVALRFWRLDNPNLWLVGGLFFGALTYGVKYSSATDAIILLGGAV